MIDSPCVNICAFDVDGRVCIGCGRTDNEIFDWSLFTDEQKSDINKQSLARLEDLKGS